MCAIGYIGLICARVCVPSLESISIFEYSAATSNHSNSFNTTIVVKMRTNIVIDTNNMRSAFSFNPIRNIFHMFFLHIIWVWLAAVTVVEYMLLLLAVALANCDTVYNTNMQIKKKKNEGFHQNQFMFFCSERHRQSYCHLPNQHMYVKYEG